MIQLKHCQLEMRPYGIETLFHERAKNIGPMFDAAAYLETVFRDCIRSDADLHDYQLEAVEWLWARPFSALFVDTGMGKTVIVDTLLDSLFTRGFRGKVLVIAPIRVCTRVWMREHRLWRHIAYFNPTLIRVDDDDPRVGQHGQTVYNLARSIGKSPAEATKARGRAETSAKNKIREALLNSRSPIHVINQEAVPWLVSWYVEKKASGKLRELKPWPYSIVIFDESSRLRDHNSEVFKSLKRIRHRVKRFHELTATPASQTYMHLFAQMWMLDKGERLGSTITPFRQKYFDQNIYNHTWTIRDGAAEQIEEKIADICLVMRRKHNSIIHTRRIELPPSVMQQYQEFERDSILEIPDGEVIDAVNGAVLSNKLLQFASGAVYDATKRYHAIHDEKIEDLRQLVTETLDNPVMVAYWYKSSLARLRAAFPQAVVMDREGKIEDGWNKRKYKMMLVHPRGVAHGLNLQFGGHHIALFDIFWPLELFTQLIDRLDRPGQTHTVMVHLLSAVGTMDETVSANLEILRTAEEAMFNRLQRIRNQIRKMRYAMDAAVA